jgi:hypothetical protein
VFGPKGRGIPFSRRLVGASKAQPPVEKLLTGDQEARISATRLGPPPKGYANWALRPLARKVEIADFVKFAKFVDDNL